MNDSLRDVKKNITPWAPPNDRELTIRAKLNTGWSSRTNLFSSKSNVIADQLSNNRNSVSITSNNGASNNISDNEYYEIEKVIQRAAMIDQKEMHRISRLYQRYNSMNKPQGNGDTECLICNCNFGLLAANPRICNNCLKNVCSSCSIDALSTSKHATIWLCKICAEYRDFLKKSGAWFNKKIPFAVEQPTVLPLSSSAGTTPSANNTPVSSVNKTLSYLNKNTSISSSTSISSNNTNEPIGQVNANTALSQHSLNLIAPNTTNTNNNYVNYNINNEKSTEIKKQQQQIAQEDVNIRNNLSNNLDDMTLLFNPSSLAKKSQTTTATPNSKNQSTYLVSSPHANENVVHDLSNDFDFEHFTREKIKQEMSNSSKLVESGPSSFSISSIASLPAPHSSPLANLQTTQSQKNCNLNKPKSISSLNEQPPTASKTIHDEILASRNGKSSKPLAVAHSSSKLDASSVSSLNSGKSTASQPELGSIQFSVEYIQSLSQLKVHLISATNLPACDSNGLSDPYVKLHLLPGIAKATKLRSKTVYKNLNPKFNETLQYDGINLLDLDEKTLRLTVLDEDKFGFDFIGEFRLPLRTIILNEVNFFDVFLEQKKQLGDETETKFRGKINFSLKYSKTTNCLFVKINKCRQLLPMDNGKSSDPFVEISLLPFSKEINSKQKFKTSVKKKTLDPEFMEEFKFTNIDLKTMLNKTIEITVWDKDFSKSDFIGVVQLSQQKTGDELKHFFTMIKNPELYHEQWHTLHMHEDHANADDSSSTNND